MDKPTFADIDARMRNDICFPKQHQVTRANIATRYRLTPALQFRNRARRHRATSCLVNVADKATAVKAGLRCVAGVAIRRADKTHRMDGDVTCLLR